jgi:hypothetical protein
MTVDSGTCSTATGCDSNCATCSKLSTWCLSCNESLPVLNVDGTCKADASTSCKAGFYLDATTKVCKQCAYNCATCENLAEECTKCHSYFTKTLLDYYNNTCVAECPERTFYDDAVKACPMCNMVC